MFDEWKIGVVVGELACQGPDSPDLVGFTCFIFQQGGSLWSCCVCKLRLGELCKKQHGEFSFDDSANTN
jgi:hypothetical protein